MAFKYNYETDVFWQDAMKVGFDKGVQQGIEQGVEKEKLDIARKMRKIGQSVDFIAEVTGLNVDVVQSITSNISGLNTD
jgi:predicted transposase/invertase (TIGR01784 family)